MRIEALQILLGLADHETGRGFWEAVGLAPTSSYDGIALGVAVADRQEARAHALAVGADDTAAADRGFLSPSGFPVHLLDPPLPETPVTTWPAGHRSRPDQLCIDVTPSAWERELEFWEQLTGWEVRPSSAPGYARLHTPATLPVRVLLQRRDEGGTTGHVDIATDDRAAEVARLEQLGAVRQLEGPLWTAFRTPGGPPVCVTARDPLTGLLPAPPS